MKELKLETRVEVYVVGELDNIYRQLYEAAFQASKKAYAPYSKFHVGAAVLLENGEILSGNNQENAAYPSVFVRSGPPYSMREHVIRMRQFRFWRSRL